MFIRTKQLPDTQQRAELKRVCADAALFAFLLNSGEQQHVFITAGGTVAYDTTLPDGSRLLSAIPAACDSTAAVYDIELATARAYNLAVAEYYAD